jgi:hypothetical protein
LDQVGCQGEHGGERGAWASAARHVTRIEVASPLSPGRNLSPAPMAISYLFASAAVRAEGRHIWSASNVVSRIRSDDDVDEDKSQDFES